MTIFTPALDAMANHASETFGPESFSDYRARHGLPRSGQTASLISIDRLQKLRPELKEATTMVFRLGASDKGTGTAFALSRLRNDWTDFFLYDATLCQSETVQPELFMSNISSRQLFAFQLLPKLTETSFVNLAIATGLLAEALKIDHPATPLLPGTGQSCFSFNVSAYDSRCPTWAHRNGQVEVDAIFVGRRQNRETLFLV